MKLCRIGDIGSEKPAIIDKENKYKLSDIKKIEMIGIFVMPFFIEYQSLMSKKLRRSNAKKNWKNYEKYWKK